MDRVLLLEAIEEITNDPEHARGSEPLRYEWAGFRAADFTRRERIIFRVCEECVRKGQTELHPLDCCGHPEASKEVITFVDFGDYHESAGRRRLRPARSYTVAQPEPPAEGNGGGPQAGKSAE